MCVFKDVHLSHFIDLLPCLLDSAHMEPNDTQQHGCGLSIDCRSIGAESGGEGAQGIIASNSTIVVIAKLIYISEVITHSSY